MKYILKIESYTGRDTIRAQSASSTDIINTDPDDLTRYLVDDALFAVITVDESGAHIVDDGYRSANEAKAAWPDAIAPELSYP